MMKNDEVRQPFLLNHDGENIAEIFKVGSVDEIRKKIQEEEGWGDYTFAFTLLNSLHKDVFGETKLMVLSSIVEGVFDTDVERLSELVQLLTNAILNEERRGKIIKIATMLGLEAVADDDPEKVFEIVEKAVMGVEGSPIE